MHKPLLTSLLQCACHWPSLLMTKLTQNCHLHQQETQKMTLKIGCNHKHCNYGNCYKLTTLIHSCSFQIHADLKAHDEKSEHNALHSWISLEAVNRQVDTWKERQLKKDYKFKIMCNSPNRGKERRAKHRHVD